MHKNLYQNKQYKVWGICDHGDGQGQGGVLSLTLFNILLDEIRKEVKAEVKKLITNNIQNMKLIFLAKWAFAGELTICASCDK